MESCGTIKKLNNSTPSTKSVIRTNALSFSNAKRTSEEPTLKTGVARRIMTPSCMIAKGFTATNPEATATSVLG